MAATRKLPGGVVMVDSFIADVPRTSPPPSSSGGESAPAPTGMAALVEYLKTIPLWVLALAFIVVLFIIFRRD